MLKVWRDMIIQNEKESMCVQFKMKDNGFYTQLEYGELHISGKEQHGFRPYQLLVGSVAVCSGGVLKRILEKQRFEVEDIRIEASVEREDDGAKAIRKIDLLFHIKAEGITPEKARKALELTRKNCSMVQSVRDSIEVTESFELA
jgi:putative redox protein